MLTSTCNAIPSYSLCATYMAHHDSCDEGLTINWKYEHKIVDNTPTLHSSWGHQASLASWAQCPHGLSLEPPLHYCSHYSPCLHLAGQCQKDNFYNGIHDTNHMKTSLLLIF